MNKILLFAFVLIAIAVFGCNKKSEKYVLKHYTKNIGGLRYWHGEYATPPHVYTTGGDSLSAMLDTFEINVINNNTINIRGNNLYFKKLNNEEGYIMFEYSYARYTMSSRIEDIIYYFHADSMRYYVFQNNQYTPYSFVLHTP